MVKYYYDNRISLFKQFISALSLYVHRISSLDSFSLTFVGHNREKEFFDTVGMFVGTYPLRIEINREDTLLDTQNKIGYMVNSIVKEHSNYPFEEIIKHYRSEFKSDINHLMNVSVIDLPFHISKDFEIHNFDIKDVQNHLTIYFDRFDDPDNPSLIRILYDSSIYRKNDIKNISKGILSILENFFKDQSLNVKDMPILPNEDVRKIKYEFNDTDEVYPEDKCLHNLFEESVTKYTDNIAIEFENESITYNELNTKADLLAEDLKNCSVGSEKTVAIYMSKCIENIIAILAVLKAGGAYVPIDPHLPVDRVNYMINDSGCKFIITESDLQKNIKISNDSCFIVYDETRYEIKYGEEFLKNDRSEATSDNLIYIIYTSGSTGEPKGVMVEHKSIVNLIHSQAQRYHHDSKQRFLHFLSFGFDASQDHLFRNLYEGNTIHLVDLNDKKKNIDIRLVLKEKKITSCAFPTSMLDALDPNDYPELKIIIVGADKCTDDTLRKWSKGRKFYNSYGPTEASILSTIAEFDSNIQNVHIGKPISNMKTYILDKYMNLLPVGCIGELYIGGIGVARGYLNNKDLTRKKFFRNPFIDGEGRMYKTGDLCYYLNDGNIQFVGRIDNQVKIRGHRIELGEIESAIKSINGIIEAHSFIYDKNDTKQISVCFVSESTVSISSIKNKLMTVLPVFMMPHRFLQLENMPRNIHGKIDTDKIIKLLGQQSDTFSDNKKLNYIESKLLNIWCQILKLEKVSIYDNFFFIGGDSLLVLEVLTEIKKDFNVDLSTDQFMESPTIVQLSALIGHKKIDSSILLPIYKANAPKGSIVYLHGFGGYSNYGFLLAKDMDIDFDQYGFKIDLNTIKKEAIINLSGLIDCYYNKILETNIKLPILVVGYSWGGIPAYELAVKLANEQSQVELLMIDVRFVGKKILTTKEKFKNTIYHYFRWQQFVKSFLSLNFQKLFVQESENFSVLLEEAKLEFKKYLFDYINPVLNIFDKHDDPNFKSPLAKTIISLDHQLSKCPKNLRINFLVTPYKQQLLRKYVPRRDQFWKRITSDNFNSIYIADTHDSLIDEKKHVTMMHIQNIANQMKK